jgi:hypothetical protein
MFITFSFRNIVLSIGYYASLGGEDTSQAKDFGIGGVASWLDGGLTVLLLDYDLKLSILSFLFADYPGVKALEAPTKCCRCRGIDR